MKSSSSTSSSSGGHNYHELLSDGDDNNASGGGGGSGGVAVTSPAAGGLSSSSSSSNNPLIDEEDARFSCNICLDPVRQPVVTQCGHLYCWPCLFRWLKTQHTTCPVCKSGVSHDSVIPVYIRGSSEHELREARAVSASGLGSGGGGGSDNSSNSNDPTEGNSNINREDDIPNRPSGRRLDISQVVANNIMLGGNNAADNGGGGGGHLSQSHGFFPSLFGLQFQYFPTAGDSIDEVNRKKLLNKVLYGVFGLVIVVLLLL